MIDGPIEESPDRIILDLDPGGPVELTDLTGSFAALARMYERHHRAEGEPAAPRLYVTRLESGSVLAEIVPYAVLLGAVVYTMDCSMIVTDFTRRLRAGIKAFADAGTPHVAKPSDPDPAPTIEDAADIREFVRPLTGKKGARLGIKHARFAKTRGDQQIVAEYTFDEAELNRAAINIDDALAKGKAPLQLEAVEDAEEVEIEGPITKEVMLFFEQASRRPGREKGRTGDRGIIPDIHSKSLPVYFRKSIQDLKDKMIRGEVNPLTNYAFVVDVHVQRVDGKPKGYIVTEVHEVMPLGEQSD
jgi:hypothetical protein